MEQKKPRPASLYVPRPNNDMSYHRTLSPGGRRLTNPARASDSNFDPYYAQRHNPYASPRASGERVVPISTQTYVNLPSTNTAGGSNRPVTGYDSYTGRPRRSSLLDTQRASGSAGTVPSRNRPTVVQNDTGRPSSPQRRDREYYITPASSKETKEPRKFEHKKLYSVDDGSAKLVADVDIPTGERHHRRRESGATGGERGGYRTLGQNMGQDRGRKAYHAANRGNRTVDDEDAFSYTDPASMYRETEPRWREARPRRGSVDRGGASRERPVSMMDPYGQDPRRSARDIGPPPSQRGWDKINDLGRSRSTREPVPRSPSRGRDEARGGAYGDPRDPYYVPPRRPSVDRRTAVHQSGPIERYDQSDYEDRPRHHERRNSVTRPKDRSVSRRGFGIRSDSQDRYGAHARGSDESFEQRKKDLARDSGYAEPHRRDTAPPEFFPEHERKRLADLDQQQYPPESRDKGLRRREHDRSFEDYERDSDRDRRQQKERERGYDRDDRRERHHHRRDTDRDHGKDRSDSVSNAARIAAGGLGAAAAMFGLNREKDKKEEREKEKDIDLQKERDREREREREQERYKEKEQERQREQDRQRESERQREADRLRAPEARFDDRKDRDGSDSDNRRRRAGTGSHSDEPSYERQRDPYSDPDRGLGFAFEGPPASAPNDATRPRETSFDAPPQAHAQAPPPQPPRPQPQREYDRDGTVERDFERERAPYDSQPAAQSQPGAVDPDEDYRRRIQQVQQELGLPAQQNAHSSDSDPDRERRRREREQRQLERQERQAANGVPESNAGYGDYAPPSMHSSFDARSNFDDGSSQATWSTIPPAGTQPELRRRPSVLDRPMEDPEAMAQIIDNSQSDKRETRVRIVDPPTEEEERKPRGILKRPTEKFPEDPNAVREGVAPLKDANKKGIPPGARWTKIDRRLVNPEALEDAKERFEERLDFVIVLRVLTKEEIQKLADRTREIRDKRHEEESRAERKASRRRERNKDRRDRDEYEDENSEDEYAPKKPMMLEAPAPAAPHSSVTGVSGGTANGDADFIRERRDRDRERERERESVYMSGGRGDRERERGYGSDAYGGA